jgi:DoxX
MSLSTVLTRAETVAQKPFPLSLASLALRFALAVPFFKSGLTKWEGFLKISETPELLFTEEFKLHIFGAVYDYPFPKLMAWGSSLGEVILPVLLVFGLGTRLVGCAWAFADDGADPADHPGWLGEFSSALGGDGDWHYCAGSGQDFAGLDIASDAIALIEQSRPTDRRFQLMSLGRRIQLALLSSLVPENSFPAAPSGESPKLHVKRAFTSNLS